MRHVYKYPMAKEMTPGKLETLRMREGSEVISLDVQHGTICIWAVVDPNAPEVNRDIVVIGTGPQFKVPNGWYHIRTWVQGAFVWHAFIGPEVKL